MKDEHPVYGFVDDDPSNYAGALALANGGSHMYAFRVQPSQPNLHRMGYGSHDLRLAWSWCNLKNLLLSEWCYVLVSQATTLVSFSYYLLLDILFRYLACGARLWWPCVSIVFLMILDWWCQVKWSCMNHAEISLGPSTAKRSLDVIGFC